QGFVRLGEIRKIVVLAGKGHEDYQEINGQRHDFSDLAEADKALTAWEVGHA
ncbi:UDP-N-acetylmuramoyl-L-alanyl-D-glutamate--2,6-diaminopimelate ligase, partial [Pseudomonas protegens]|nr:UDP-N-acetylmuramoyl-L-alanyl-D-glutamate--2,6-diaminopimelate ligase [Pseudomonas protegens]